MVIETFKPGVKETVYERFEREGRVLPDGLSYVDSWLSVDGTKCFQLMEAEDTRFFSLWIAKWEDLVDFEIIPVKDSPTKVCQSTDSTT